MSVCMCLSVCVTGTLVKQQINKEDSQTVVYTKRRNCTFTGQHPITIGQWVLTKKN